MMAESEEQSKEETGTSVERKESLNVSDDQLNKLRSSPNLPRKALDKIREEDPASLRLYTPWTFWYER